MEYKWLAIMIIGIVISSSVVHFAPSKTEEAKQETLKLEIELKNKELEILKFKGKEN